MSEGIVRSVGLGVFDRFPNVEERSSYPSSLTPIVDRVRRQNLARQELDGYTNTDPWEESSDRQTETCSCRQLSGNPVSTSRIRRRTLSKLNEERTICPGCGRKKGMDRRESSLRDQSKFNQDSHIRQFLQSTPQLRLICKESTDISGSSQSLNLADLVGVTNRDKQRTHEEEYSELLERKEVNERVAGTLVSILWSLSHEMSLEDYGFVENKVFSEVFELVHSHEKNVKLAGLVAVGALLRAPSSDEERKTIKFANTLTTSLRAARGDFEVLDAVAKALGNMAMRVSNVDFVESEIIRAMEWLRTERSDRR